MKRKLGPATLAVATFAFAGAAQATNGDQMIGVSATQWGMGGAAVAAPQDAGTILTNPAGIATLGIKEVRFDTGIGLLNPPRKVNGFESDSNFYMMPSGAVAFNVNDRAFIGLGMGGLSGMGVDFPDVAAAPGNQSFVTTKQFFKVAPGLAYRVTDKLSIGGAINIDYQSLAIYNAGFSLPQNQVYGYGATLGAIYKLNDMVQLGASWISRQKMSDFKWNIAGGNATFPAPLGFQTWTGGSAELQMDAPQQISFGIAVRPIKSLLIEADVKHIGFSDVMNSIPVTRTGGLPPSVPAAFNFGWEDQWVYAIGAQYDLNDRTQLRVGLNYGESPIGPEDVNNNIGSLAVTELHATVGVTRWWTDRIATSVSYAHAFHNKVTSNVAPFNTIELEQNILTLQVTYRF